MKTIYCIEVGGVIKTLFGCHQNDPQPEGYVEHEIADDSPDPGIGDSIINSVVIPAPPPAPVIPKIERLQARLALLSVSKWSLIQPQIDALDEPQRSIAQAYFEDARTWARNDPFVLLLAPKIGLDAAATDTLFITASTLALTA